MYLIIYDISDDRVRRKVDRICKDYGLTRVQKSAFRGNMRAEQRKRIEEELFNTIRDYPDDNIQIYFICEEDYRKGVCITGGEIKGFEKEKEEEIWIYG